MKPHESSQRPAPSQVQVNSEALELRAQIDWLRAGGRGTLTPLLTVSPEGDEFRAHLSAWRPERQEGARRPARLTDRTQLERLAALALREAPCYGLKRRWRSARSLWREARSLEADSLDVLLTSERGGAAEAGGGAQEVLLEGGSLDLSLALALCLWISDLTPQVMVACSAECDEQGQLKPVRGLAAKARALAPCEGVTRLLVACGQEGEAREALRAAGLSERIEACGVKTLSDALRLTLGRFSAPERLEEHTASELERLSDHELVTLARDLSQLTFAFSSERGHLSKQRLNELIALTSNALSAPHRAGARELLGPLMSAALEEARLAARRHVGGLEEDREWIAAAATLMRLLGEGRRARARAPTSSAARLLGTARRLSMGCLTEHIACEGLASRLQSLTDQTLLGLELLARDEVKGLLDEIDAVLQTGALSVGLSKLWGARARWRLASGCAEEALSDASEALARWEELSQSASGAERTLLLTESSYPLVVAYHAVAHREGAGLERLERLEELKALEELEEALRAEGVAPSWYSSVERAGVLLRLDAAGDGTKAIETISALLSAIALRAPDAIVSPAQQLLPWGLAPVAPQPYLAGIAAARLTQRFGARWARGANVDAVFELLARKPERQEPYLALQRSYCRALLCGDLDAPVSASLSLNELNAIQGLGQVTRGLGGDLSALTWRALAARCLYL